jgi:hypothetical protein
VGRNPPRGGHEGQREECVGCGSQSSRSVEVEGSEEVGGLLSSASPSLPTRQCFVRRMRRGLYKQDGPLKQPGPPSDTLCCGRVPCAQSRCS